MLADHAFVIEAIVMNAADRSCDSLLERAGRGDGSAIGRLLERHRLRLKAVVAARIDRRIAARVDASDVVQEALTEAGRRLPEFLHAREMSWFPWLRVLTFQRLADLHRRHRRSRKRSVVREIIASGIAIDRTRGDLICSDTSPSGHALRSEEQERVRVILDGLTEKDRRILELRYYQGRSFEEIARELGIGIGAAKMRHLRALERFGMRIPSHDKDRTR